MATLQLVEDKHACLFSAVRDDDPSNLEQHRARLLRDRDLSVVALRLAGFTRFHDPELLGTFIYQGSLRWRQPTVIRQTVLNGLGVRATETFPEDGQRLTAPFIQTLYEYDRRARHPDVEHVLTLFRRSFDRRFLPPTTVAGLLFSGLEAMLGRFRRRQDRVQLEDLLELIVGGGPATDWFRADGRALRNSVAHGVFRADEEGDAPALDHLRSLLLGTLPAFLTCWLDTHERQEARPATVFIARWSG